MEVSAIIFLTIPFKDCLNVKYYSAQIVLANKRYQSRELLCVNMFRLSQRWVNSFTVRTTLQFEQVEFWEWNFVFQFVLR